MSEHLYFDTLREGDVLILRPHLRFNDLRDVNEFQDELLDYLELRKPAKLIVDFCNVTRISSWFLGTMLRLERKLHSHHGVLKLCHMNKTVREVFHVTALDRHGFEIVDTLDSALAAFQTPPGTATQAASSK